MKSVRYMMLVIVAVVLLPSSNLLVSNTAKASTESVSIESEASASVIGVIFEQPVNPTGVLYQSSWLDPDGSDYDQYVWDNFTFQANETVNEIHWIGGYDPLRNGNGGPVVDFNVQIYPSNAPGTEPDVAHPPLVDYMTGGNAGETLYGSVGGITMYSYSFVLPVSFDATAGIKYWVQIEAFQHGIVPDWGFSAGTGGNSSHFKRMVGAGGDIIYLTVPGDVSFSLWGPIIDTPTDVAISSNLVDENMPINTIVGELTAADPDPNATFTFSLTCAVGGADDGSFNILDINLRTSEVFDYETKSAYNICIRVTDQNALTYDENFVIYVNNLPDQLLTFFLPSISK